VFYLFPWLGYTLLGGALAVFFQNQYLEFKKWILPFALTGFGLVLASSWLFKITADLFNISLFQKIAWNNYLFIRLGDVFILLSLFMALESYLKSRYWKFIGRHTLELYILHYLVLYGSLTGYGLYKFYANELTLLTTLGCTLISLILIILGSFAIKKIRNRNKHFN
jgi:peptidoglycan/LPS O-acetylase OafA/YrhL